ncbi:hypothetical protein LZ554_007345 [Drepanopeziza brunnea f. sp. 'monogermtubi']|nr:hypothetical protein LZ554_007345 [Drepanopeziza brunnea f. sp. 'monogermtubi']
MNRYARGPAAASSKATASTLCQKCLKRGHYSYECKAVVQERPYVSRPSRTQQLLNPKLQPRLMTSDAPLDLMRKKGIADELLAKADQERGRKRERQSEEAEAPGTSKRMRSASSASVSSISTGISRSPSPHQATRDYSTRKSTPRNGAPPSRQRSPTMSVSPPRNRHADPERKRRRDSFSSADSYSSAERKPSRERASSRSTRRRFQQSDPPARGRTTESRSPYRKRRDLSNDRQHARNRLSGIENRLPPPKERSLSPFSKRLALTQAMNGGGR